MKEYVISRYRAISLFLSIVWRRMYPDIWQSRLGIKDAWSVSRFVCIERTVSDD